MIQKGNTVTVHYTGSLDDGTVFDSSEEHDEPLTVTIGEGQVIPGFEDGLIGMKQGDEKDIVIEAKDAYGDYNPQLTGKLPKTQLPKEPEPAEGMVLMISLPQGQQMPARITKVEADSVVIDLNHPLAGKRLHFKLKVVEVN
ncbi:peptidylprolyl isomerase [Candidatus Woesearchaeota archaeon]|nr:MAG: peptidylprolyl isomerase [Candidatus Woesearchaeota archaeon]